MKPGDIIRDNDPRMGVRKLEIIAFDGPEHVRCRRKLVNGKYSAYPAKGFRIRKDRIHTDGKKRKSGFTLLSAS